MCEGNESVRKFRGTSVVLFRNQMPRRGAYSQLRESDDEDPWESLAIGAQINQHPLSLMRTGHCG